MLSPEGLGGPARPLEMAEVGDVLGALWAAELDLFRRLGRAAPSLPEAPEVVWASATSLRAAWRAVELERLLPVSAGLARPSGGTSPLDGGAEVTDVEVPVAGQNVLEDAAGRYDELAEAYRFRLGHLSPAADGPVERCLRHVLADLEWEQEALRHVAKPPGRYP